MKQAPLIGSQCPSPFMKIFSPLLKHVKIALQLRMNIEKVLRWHGTYSRLTKANFSFIDAFIIDTRGKSLNYCG